MKKLLAIFILLLSGMLNTFAQCDSIGIYPVCQTYNDFYMYSGSDTVWLDNDYITIKFNDSIDSSGRANFCQDYNLTYLKTTAQNYHDYQLQNPANFIQTCDSIYSDTRVEIFNFCYFLNLHRFIPNDTDHGDQWYLDTIKAYEAWDLCMGDESIVVAVIDDGFFIDHDELGYNNDNVENFYHNGDNGEKEDDWTQYYDPETGNANDDDDNGKEDDWKGWNFNDHPGFNQNNNVIPEFSVKYHGTSVSGIISAKLNNEEYMSGIAGGNFDEGKGGVKILPIKLFDYYLFNGEILLSSRSIDLPDAINYAREQNADIINMSIGFVNVGQPYQAIEDAVNAAYEDGILLVAATGNKGKFGEIEVPAKMENVVAVGASDKGDEAAYFSDKGNEIEIVAPGIDILSLDNDGVTSGLWGTSYSTAMVSATAALMLSVNPDLDNWKIRDILKTTAEKVGSNIYYDGWNSNMGYGRLNTYWAVCGALEELPEITIETSGVWDEPVFSLKNITVETGNTLTITSRVSMGKDAKFIIQPGAKVIIDGGKVTNYKHCGHEDNQWPGFEVWGSSTDHQFTVNDTNAQGRLILKNNAIIENAVTAVELWKPGDYSKTGGFVTANNAFFLNNARSIHAINYENFDPNNVDTQVDNLCYFENCVFEIDEDYISSPSGPTFFKHIDLDRVNGIKFKGCDFSMIEVEGVSEWNNGIASYSAGFKVYARCTSTANPCTNWDECTFNGFRKGIYAGNPHNKDYTFSVSRALFEHNKYGISVKSINNFAVLNSDFYVGYNDDINDECRDRELQAAGYGINIENSTGFAIEDNYFTKAFGTGSSYYVGIYTLNTNAVNEIYRNSFDGLSFGIYAEGLNYNEVTYHGLAFYCNDNVGNYEDFTVKPIEWFDGIQSEFGSKEKSAGNTFSPMASINFNNNAIYPIVYYYYDAPYQYPEVEVNVGREEVIYENQCPPHYGYSQGESKDLLLTGSQLQAAKSDFSADSSDFIKTKATYDSLVDGGNTQYLLDEIEDAQPPDSTLLFSLLNSKSPFLSVEVLIEASDKTSVLSDSAIYKLLAANPDEIWRSDLIDHLRNKQQALSEAMIDSLQLLDTVFTYKTELHAEMGYYKQGKAKAAHEIIRSLLNDTIENTSGLYTWIDRIDGKRAKEQIISLMLKQADYDEALALADSMPNMFDYQGRELVEHNYYEDMLEIMIDLSDKGLDVSQLDSTQLQTVKNIADSSLDVAGTQARAILNYAYDYHYCDCLSINDTLGFKETIAEIQDADIHEEDFGVSVEPNPAKDRITFVYALEQTKKASIKILDISGRMIRQLPLEGKTGRKNMQLNSMKAGIYFYVVETSNKRYSGKFIISK